MLLGRESVNVAVDDFSLFYTRSNTSLLRKNAQVGVFSSGLNLVVGTFSMFSLKPLVRTQSPCKGSLLGGLTCRNRLTFGYFITCFILEEKERSDQDLGSYLDPD